MGYVVASEKVNVLGASPFKLGNFKYERYL